VRPDRLLKSLRHQTGSAPVETVFALAILLFLVLGTVQVAFALYGRNVVAASAHEGARAAIELGRNPADAIGVARGTVVRSAGGLVEGLRVGVHVDRAGTASIVRVRVTGRLKALGPVPLPLPVDTVATSTRHSAPR
jgi:Flp pilus assembly protein TadG